MEHNSTENSKLVLYLAAFMIAFNFTSMVDILVAFSFVLDYQVL